MPGWFGWLIAGISTVGFVSLWFWEVRRVLRNYRSMVQCAAGQLVSCRKRLAKCRFRLYNRQRPWTSPPGRT